MIAGYFGISNMGFCRRRLAVTRAAVEAAIQRSLPAAPVPPAAARREERPVREQN